MAVKLLRTTMTGYEVFNLLSSDVAAFEARRDLTAQVDDVAVTFTTPENFAAGTLEVYLGGVMQNDVTEHPGGNLNQFSLSRAPMTVDGALEALYSKG